MTNLGTLDFHQLSEMAFELWTAIGRGTATAEERVEYAAISAEIDKRKAEHAAFTLEGGTFISESEMARWGIDYSDCIDYPSY